LILLNYTRDSSLTKIYTNNLWSFSIFSFLDTTLVGFYHFFV
jgi:hypothetical protein